MSGQRDSRIIRAYLKLLRAMHAPLRRMRSVREVRSPDLFDAFVERTRHVASPRILELGSRNVTGTVYRRHFPHAGEYVGVDIHPGEGVDVVCDAHELSRAVPNDHFDFAFSVSVFEHLLFPWKVAMELNAVLASGGLAFTMSHTAWPAHELPWDFWRFPANGLHALFNQATGFEVLEIQESRPARMYSLSRERPTRDNCMTPLNQVIAVIARKTGDYRRDLIRWDVPLSDVVDSIYPKPR